MREYKRIITKALKEYEELKGLKSYDNIVKKIDVLDSAFYAEYQKNNEKPFELMGYYGSFFVGFSSEKKNGEEIFEICKYVYIYNEEEELIFSGNIECLSIENLKK